MNRARPRSDAELNLIPLIDIMSVLVAFLLIYSTEVEVVQNTKGIEIPQSSAEVKPQQSVVVMVTKEHLFVQGEPIATIAEVQSAATPLIEPLREVLERPMLAGAASDEDASSREDHRDRRQELAVRYREESDGHVHVFLVREDLAGRPAEGEGSQCR